MDITVTGLGYLGLVHAAALAEMGHHVLGMDTDTEKIRQLRAGTVPVHEHGLQELWSEHVDAGTLAVTGDAADVAAHGNVHFLCIGTPVDGSGVLTQLFDAAGTIAGHLPAGSSHLFVGKSTVPPGTATELQLFLQASASDVDVDVAWNPEFLREGSAVSDSLYPDRQVFGVNSVHAEHVLKEIYRAEYTIDPPAFPFRIIVTDVTTAELCKLACNAFLATKISFMNAMAPYAQKTGADIRTVSEIMGMDSRIGSGYLQPGLGFGGGCLPKDLMILENDAELNAAYPLRKLIRAVDAINCYRRRDVVNLARERLGDLEGKHVTILGAAFKPGTDDIRESSGLFLAETFNSHDAVVMIHDPAVRKSVHIPKHGKYPYLWAHAPAATAVDGADLVVLATDWPEYGKLDPSELNPRRKLIIDGRYFLDPVKWRAAGWEYHVI